MAFSHLASSLVIFTLASSSLLFLQPRPTNAEALNSCHFKCIFNFGDAISDTGNIILEKPISAAATPYASLPYGETFFKHATGRASDGRLMIDFIAQAAGLPFLKPYLEKHGDFKHGVNFAVAGATAIKAEVLAKENITNPYTNNSLQVQLDWMSKYSKERGCRCMEKQKTSLFLLGEIGANDYNYAFLDGKSEQYVYGMVQGVVAEISHGVKVIIKQGAVKVVVPGIFPNGCFPVYLTVFQTNDSSAYDKHGCLKEFNTFAKYHNEKLKEALQVLKSEYPDVIIVYGDYYRAFQWLFDHAVKLGFDAETTLKACCGIGGDYNFNLTNLCSSEVPVCPNPNQYISWDGIHLTEAAYMRMAEWLIADMLPKLECCNY